VNLLNKNLNKVDITDDQNTSISIFFKNKVALNTKNSNSKTKVFILFVMTR
jgi:hypothetical protein